MRSRPYAGQATDWRPTVVESQGTSDRVRDRLSTLRQRTTAAAVIVVAVALVIAGVAMVFLLRRALTDDVRAAALHRAEAVADQFPSEEQQQVLDAGDEDEEYVQVLDGERVVMASSNLDGLPAVVALSPGESQQVDQLPFEDGPFLAIARPASNSDGQLTVVVGRSLEGVSESSGAVVVLLSAVIPLLLLTMGAVAWRVVGRALAPVEAIRKEVEAISSTELHRRVPHPPGNDEIARLATTMNEMLARLEEGQSRQRHFVSDASHELRSPVTTIRQHAEVALAHPDAASVGELAEVVLEEDSRLQHLVDDLLLLTRMDEGTVHRRTVSVDVDDLLFEEAERLRATTDLRIDTADVSAGRVSGDRGQLTKLIRNLTDNAARHAHTAIALSLREDRAGAVLTVEDDGDGIPPSKRQRIFERFVRLDEARDRDSGGSGLGLAIVAEIAAAHGASIVLLDGTLGGSRFEVRFPSTPD
jgi:signal transduction histidine kinase